MNKPAGFTAEGTFTPDRLHAGDHPVRTIGVTLQTGLTLTRGTLVGLTSGETEYEAYAGGTLTTGALLGLLVEDEDTATVAGAKSVMVYVAGDFNANSITIASGGALATVRAQLTAQSLYVHDAVAA